MAAWTDRARGAQDDISSCILLVSVASKWGVKASELTHWKQRLIAMRAEILAEGDVAIEPVRKDDTRVGSEEDEQPLVEMSQVIASKRNRERTLALQRVSKALARIESEPELFGLCRECEEPIGKRLEAMPYAEFCVECQQTSDGGRKPGRRRHLLDFK
jgi:DnaK suppressor protein